MTDKIIFLKEKGKLFSKEDQKFYSGASIEQLERAGNIRDISAFAWLDSLDDRGEIDFKNPPAIWAITFQRWIWKKYGLKWLVNYLKKGEYGGRENLINGRLEALGVTEAEITAIDDPVKVKIAGVSFENRQKALERLTYYAPEEILTVLVPEPGNRYDPDAIAVKVLVDGTEQPYCIGYIPRTEIAKVRPLVWKFPELKICRGNSYTAELKIA